MPATFSGPAAALLALFLALAPAPVRGADGQAPGPASGKIKILVTNDVHGRVFEDPAKGNIGLALVKGRVTAAEKEGYRVFLMDAGDAVAGNAVTQFDSGISIAELMGRIGYRVVSPGNHAFDFNDSQGSPLYYPNVLLQQMRDHAPGDFDAVSLNLTYNGGDVPGIRREPVVLIDEPDFRLAVVGVLTPYTRKIHNEKSVAGYDFGLVGPPDSPDHAATKQNILALLTRALRGFDRPGDVVVVLSHVGSGDGDDYLHGELRGSDLATVPNVDFVVDSHSHNLVPAEKIGDVYYGIANRYLDHIAELTVENIPGVLEKRMEIRGYDDMKDYPKSEEILTRLRELSDRLGLGERLFQLPEPAMDDRGADRESVAIGRLIGRGMVGVTGADLAITNNGGIRAPLSAGWVTAGNLYDVLPYQNNIVTFNLTGREIRELFDGMLLRRTNAFPQIYGMTVFTWEEEGDPVLKVAGILDRTGAPLNPDAVYRVAMNDFIAYGGDGYSIDTSRPDKSYGDMVTGLILYLRNRGVEASEAVRENDALLVYPSREEAEKAFSNPQFTIHNSQL